MDVPIIISKILHSTVFLIFVLRELKKELMLEYEIQLVR